MTTKGFRDSIHGFIDLHPLLVKVIDTPQFQRLRNIKQLGGKYHVYPGACHNRFEHSIGTCYLAGKLARHLQDKQKKEEMKEDDALFITDKDILCVELAGLCHDLGHGPFSHLFDGQFMKRFPDNDGDCWKHEKGSCDMFDQLIKKNGELEKLFDNKLDNDDIKFIKEMINPPGNAKDYKERPNKPFLYEIISNKENEVDVDKWDYLARDCHHLGQKNTFDHNRYISLTKVVECDGKDGKVEHHIAVRDKEQRNLYEMFHVRDYLHKSVYQHDVGNAVEEMIADALFLADENVTFKGTNDQGGPKNFTISEAVDNMEAYEKLNDSVLDIILYQNAEEGSDLEKAQNTLERIQARDFYRRFGETCSNKSFSSDKKDLCERAKEKFEEIFEEKKKNNEVLDCFVVLKKFNFGFKDKDPVKKCWFFTKESPKVAKQPSDDVSYMLPKIFQEFQLVVYNKTSKKDLNQGLKNEEAELLKKLKTAWKSLEKKYKEKEFWETFLNAWKKLEREVKEKQTFEAFRKAWKKLEGENIEKDLLKDLQAAWEKLEKEKCFEAFLNVWKKLEGEDEENDLLKDWQAAWKNLGKGGEEKKFPEYLQTKLENFEKKDKKRKLLKDWQAAWENVGKEKCVEAFLNACIELEEENDLLKDWQAAWEKLGKEKRFEAFLKAWKKLEGENDLLKDWQAAWEKLGKEKDFEAFLKAWKKLEGENIKIDLLKDLQAAWENVGKEKKIEALLNAWENLEGENIENDLLKNLQAAWEKLRKEKKFEDFLNAWKKLEEENKENDLLKDWQAALKKLGKEKCVEAFLNAWIELEEENKENDLLKDWQAAWEKLGKEGKEKELPEYLQTKLENFEKRDKKIKLLKDWQAAWEKLKTEKKEFLENLRDKELAADKDIKFFKEELEKLKEELCSKELQEAYEKLENESKEKKLLKDMLEAFKSPEIETKKPQSKTK